MKKPIENTITDTDGKAEVKNNKNARLESAMDAGNLLLSYATEHGKEIEKGKIDTIVKCSHKFEETRTLDPKDETEFWDAYKHLCAAVHPVSTESLKATESSVYGNQKSLATKSVKNYQILTIICLFVLLVLQCYWVTISTLVKDIKQLQVSSEKLELSIEEKINQQQATLTTENGRLQAILADEIGKLQTSIDDGTSQFKREQIGAKIEQLKIDADAEQEANKAKTNRRIEKLASDAIERLAEIDSERAALFDFLQRLNFFTLLQSDNGEDSDFIYGKSVGSVTLKTGIVATDLMSLYVLPILYGLLGACAYILRSLSYQITNRTFTNASTIRLQLRFFLGMLAGFSVAWFTTGPDGGFFQSIAPLALAFVAGYSVEIVFSAMDAIIGAFSKDSARPAE